MNNTVGNSALENGKHFYVYSSESYELIIGNEAIDLGYYEYVRCQYDAQQRILIEKVIPVDPKPHLWITCLD